MPFRLVILLFLVATLPIAASANLLRQRMRHNCRVFRPMVTDIQRSNEARWIEDLQRPGEPEWFDTFDRRAGLDQMSPDDAFENQEKAASLFEILASIEPHSVGKTILGVVEPFEMGTFTEPDWWRFELVAVPKGISQPPYFLKLLIDQLSVFTASTQGEFVLRISWRPGTPMTPARAESLTRQIHDVFRKTSFPQHFSILRKKPQLRGFFAKKTASEFELPYALFLFVDASQRDVAARYALNVGFLKALNEELSSGGGVVTRWPQLRAVAP